MQDIEVFLFPCIVYTIQKTVFPPGQILWVEEVRDGLSTMFNQCCKTFFSSIKCKLKVGEQD